MPRSEHQSFIAKWIDLVDGDAYRLKVRVWSRVNGQDVMSAGTILFTQGPQQPTYQDQFDQRGGLAQAFQSTGVPIDVYLGDQSSIELSPDSQQGNMTLRLELHGPGGQVQSAFQVTVTGDARIGLRTLPCSQTGVTP